MQTSVRRRRSSPVSGPNTAVVPGETAGGRSLFQGLRALFEAKPVNEANEDDDNALLAFPSEGAPREESRASPDPAPQPAPRVSGPPRPSLVRPMLVVVAILVVSALVILAIRRFPVLPSTTAPQSGNLTIDTRLVVSEVLIDGERRGVTPLTLSLSPGPHTITVRTASDERVVPVTILAGAQVTQYFEMKVAAPASVSGQVSVMSDAPDARVAVDGQPRGASPITVAGLTPGEHKVTVTSSTGSVERTVVVTAGGTASVVFSGSKAGGPVGGWLSIATPFEVEVAENDDVIGASGASRIMLAAGRHTVTLTNRDLGFQESRRIDVTAGKTTAIRVDAPKASVSVNARPWAEITLDGSNLGQTPIANLLVSVGPHELVFSHPQLGERKQTVVVTAKGPNRIAVDFTK